MFKADAKNFIESEIFPRWTKWGSWDKETGEHTVSTQELESWISILMEFDPETAKQAVEQLYREGNNSSPNPKKFISFARDIRTAKRTKVPTTKKTIIETGYFVQLVNHNDWRKIGQYQPVYVEPLTVQLSDAIYEKAMNQLAARLKECYGGEWVGFSKTTNGEMSKRRYELHLAAKETAGQAAIENQKQTEEINTVIEAELAEVAKKLQTAQSQQVSNVSHETENELNNLDWSGSNEAAEAIVGDADDDRPF
jgi:DNA polymerase III gamma/tau subunit